MKDQEQAINGKRRTQHELPSQAESTTSNTAWHPLSGARKVKWKDEKGEQTLTSKQRCFSLGLEKTPKANLLSTHLGHNHS